MYVEIIAWHLKPYMLNKHLHIQRGPDDAAELDELRHHAVHNGDGYAEADARGCACAAWAIN